MILEVTQFNFFSGLWAENTSVNVNMDMNVEGNRSGGVSRRRQIELQTDDIRWESNYVVMVVIFEIKTHE